MVYRFQISYCNKIGSIVKLVQLVLELRSNDIGFWRALHLPGIKVRNQTRKGEALELSVVRLLGSLFMMHAFCPYLYAGARLETNGHVLIF